MVGDCISIYGFLEDKTSNKGKVLTLFEDGIAVKEKSGRRGSRILDSRSNIIIFLKQIPCGNLNEVCAL